MMGVARNEWIASDKSSTMESKKRTGNTPTESALATQLQQLWLQTQLPKRDVPQLDFLSPLPSTDNLARSSSSSSFSQTSPPTIFPSPDSHSEEANGIDRTQGGGGNMQELDPFGKEWNPQEGEEDMQGVDPYGKDWTPMDDEFRLQYLESILMEEDMHEKKCMYLQCTAHQAITQELEDLIKPETSPAAHQANSNSNSDGKRERSEAVRDWMDEVPSSSPQQSLYENGTIGVTQQQQQQQNWDRSPEVSSSEAVAAAQGSISEHELDAHLSNIYLDNPDPEKLKPLIPVIDYAQGRSGIESLVELYPVLMRCAQAVAADDVRGAQRLINQLQQQASPYGDGGQRMTFYFVEALVARLSGTGAQLYTALRSNGPSMTEMLTAYKMHVQVNPLPKIVHFFANANIYNAIKNAARVHIVDFGILYGAQWACLLRKLSQRPGGPPFVRLTGIDFQTPGFNKKQRVQETGKRLANIAKTYGVEFEYQAIASSKWETIQTQELNLKKNEVIIVNCMFRLRNVLDESVIASSPRKTLLTKLVGLNPRLFVMGIISSEINTPFFLGRFREAINRFSAEFDALHSSAPPNAELRTIFEREVFGREILNILACEGPERIERAETYAQWQSRAMNAGFVPQPMNPEIFQKVQTFLAPFNKNYGIATDGNWLLTGWKDRVLHGVLTLRPAQTPPNQK